MIRKRAFQGYQVGVKYAVSMATRWVRFDFVPPSFTTTKCRLIDPIDADAPGADDVTDCTPSLFDGEQLQQVLDQASDLIGEDEVAGLVVQPVFVELPKVGAARTRKLTVLPAIPPAKKGRKR